MAFGNVNGMGSWGVALAASLALHVVVLGVMLGARGCGGNGAPPPTPQTDGRANDFSQRNDVEQKSEQSSEQPPAALDTKTESSTKREKTKAQDARKASGKSDRLKSESKKTPVAKDENSDMDVVKDGWKSYKVKAGDSLTKIARACGVTVQELAKANGLSATANLKLGQTIKVKDMPAEGEVAK